MIKIQIKEHLATKIYSEINSKISKHVSQIKMQKTNSSSRLNLSETTNGYISLILSKSADFLLEGNTWKEQQNGVEFLGFQHESLKGKRVNHFRNCEISHEIIFLKECWA